MKDRSRVCGTLWRRFRALELGIHGLVPMAIAVENDYAEARAHQAQGIASALVKLSEALEAVRQ